MARPNSRPALNPFRRPANLLRNYGIIDHALGKCVADSGNTCRMRFHEFCRYFVDSTSRLDSFFRKADAYRISRQTPPFSSASFATKLRAKRGALNAMVLKRIFRQRFQR